MCKVNKCSDMIVGSEPQYTFGNYDRPTDQPMDRKTDRLSHREGDYRRKEKERERERDRGRERERCEPYQYLINTLYIFSMVKP